MKYDILAKQKKNMIKMQTVLNKIKKKSTVKASTKYKHI